MGQQSSSNNEVVVKYMKIQCMYDASGGQQTTSPVPDVMSLCNEYHSSGGEALCSTFDDQGGYSHENIKKDTRFYNPSTFKSYIDRYENSATGCQGYDYRIMGITLEYRNYYDEKCPASGIIPYGWDDSTPRY
jgi:hypothetical protein